MQASSACGRDVRVVGGDTAVGVRGHHAAAGTARALHDARSEPRGWTLLDPGTGQGNQPWLNGRFIWRLGYDPAHWEQAVDTKVTSTALRHGNLDLLTNTLGWDPSVADHTLPPSLYLPQRPAFFSAGKGYGWPWVDPTASSPVGTLPARARYDANTPFAQP